METHATTINSIPLKKVHARRLREVYRSAGWPCLDVVEIELLAAGLLERLSDPTGHERVRVTDLGIAYLAGAAQTNRKAMYAHDGLVDRIVQTMLRDGRLVWTNLNLRAKVNQWRLSDAVVMLIDRHGGQNSVRAAIWSSLNTFSWSGSLIPYYDRMIEVLEPLRRHEREVVRTWAQTLISEAQVSRERERLRDAEQMVGRY